MYLACGWRDVWLSHSVPPRCHTQACRCRNTTELITPESITGLQTERNNFKAVGEGVIEIRSSIVIKYAYDLLLQSIRIRLTVGDCEWRHNKLIMKLFPHTLFDILLHSATWFPVESLIVYGVFSEIWIFLLFHLSITSHNLWPACKKAGYRWQIIAPHVVQISRGFFLWHRSF